MLLVNSLVSTVSTFSVDSSCPNYFRFLDDILLVCVSHGFVWRCWFEFAVSSLKQPSLQASECTCDAVTVTMEQVAIWVFCRVCNISQWFLDTLTNPFFVCLHKPTKSWGVGFSHSVRSNVSRQRLKVLFVVALLQFNLELRETAPFSGLRASVYSRHLASKDACYSGWMISK